VSQCDARVLHHHDGVRLREVLDVAGRVVDLLDLQRVDDEPELLHLRSGGRARRLGELVALANQILDREAPADRAEMPREHVLNARVHHVLLIEEPARGVRDRREVVADLIDHDGLEMDRDALLCHAVDGEIGFVEVERELTDDLHARDDERAVARDHLEAHALGLRRRIAARPEAGDDERFVGLGNAPHRFEDDDGEQADHDDDRADRDCKRRETRCDHDDSSRPHGGGRTYSRRRDDDRPWRMICSTTTTRVPTGSGSSSAQP